MVQNMGQQRGEKRHSQQNESEKNATADRVLRELIPRTGFQRQCVCSMIMPIKSNGQNIFEKVVQNRYRCLISRERARVKFIKFLGFGYRAYFHPQKSDMQCPLCLKFS